MKRFTLLALSGLIAIGTLPMNAKAEHHPTAIAIHGGAGTISRKEMTPEREQAIRAALEASARAGHEILVAGGSAMDAVTASVRVLEDSPHFNAGRGAVFNAEGVNEMDASIMDGSDLSAGAVAAVKTVKNPIDLARSVMTNSEHVMLIGAGAEQFAAEQGFETMPAEYFRTEHRWEQLQKVKADETARTDAASPAHAVDLEDADGERHRWYSTVGAVALDQHGDLAAATSTGGMTNKQWGRVGDSPIVGAGTYANNASCAVSGTGHGEYFIRYVVAYDICNRVERGASLQQAADSVVNDVLVKAGGEGGVIAVDHQGNIAMPFNSPGMYRASIGRDGSLEVEIYGEGTEGRESTISH